jgi:ComF family protein
MSSFLDALALQALKNSAGAIFALQQDCLLCAAPAGRDVICGDCDASLPRLRACCVRCAVPLPQASICGMCQRRAPRYDDALAAFEYRFPLDRLIHRFKYSGDLAVGRWLSLRLAERARAAPLPDLVIGVPLTPARLRSRGFNQATEIAKIVAKRLGVRSSIGALSRMRDTEPQPGLRRRQRRANLRGAFRCDAAFGAEHVAVVDDVMTTGATADEVATVLRQAGARRVSIWALARTPDPAAD